MDYSILELISLIGTSIAIYISVKAYMLHGKQPNENKIFEEKLRCYSEIIKILNQTINTVVLGIEDAIYEKIQKEEGWKEEIEEIDEEIYVAISLFEDVVFETSIYQPSAVSDELSNYLKHFDGDLVIKYSTTAKLEKYSDVLNMAFDKLVNLVRKDIAFEELDNNLRSRISAPENLKHTRRIDNN
jgi:hypothetical protein